MNVIQPFKRRIVIEAVIKALLIGLLVAGLIMVGVAGVSLLVFNHAETMFIVIGAVVSSLAGLITGVIKFLKEKKEKLLQLDKRMDQLGLEERVSTMTEYMNDKSYVARLQREDAKKHISQLNIKKFKINTYKKLFIKCLSILLIILLVFSVYAVEPNPHYKKAQEVIEFLDEIIDSSDMSQADKDALGEIMDGYKDSLKEDISKEEHLDILEQTKDKLEDYLNQQKEIRDTIIESLKSNDITEDLADAIEKQDPDKIQDALDKIKEEIEKQPTPEEKQEMIDKVQDAFQDAVDSTKEDSELKDAFEEAIKDLEKVEEELDKIKEQQKENPESTVD